MTFTNTPLWQKGLKLTKELFLCLEGCRMWSLADQLRRASTSTLANYAEGFGRRTDADKLHKYVIARGECTEVEALLIIAHEVSVLSQAQFAPLQESSIEMGRMLSGLIRKYSKD